VPVKFVLERTCRSLDNSGIMRLKIATCQFADDFNPEKNCRRMLSLMRKAAVKKAEVVHFHEACLSGYPKGEQTFKAYPWKTLRDCTLEIAKEASRLKLWVIFGSTHRFSPKRKPFNCLYVVNPSGKFVERYDKMFCTGGPACTSGDLKHYHAGSHFSVFTIKGIKCGLQICHDFRYQELYREYKKRGVQLMFHSYHNAFVKRDGRKNSDIRAALVPATMQAYAANNYMWISSNNSMGYYSSWPSFCVSPDGMITGSLRGNTTSILYTTVDTKAEFYDAAKHWRDRAMRGVFYSGSLVKDRDSRQRFSFVT
jgi:deaminated glutathione amidase